MAQEINLVDLDWYERDGAPHEALRWLRAHAPVFWHADGGAPGWPGFWAVTGHEDVGHVSRHPEIFSSSRRLAFFDEDPEDQVGLQRLMMLNMDPPQHTRQRDFVSRGFTPRIIGRLEKHIREICDGLIDGVALRDSADFVRDIAAPFPLHVIGELIGAPPADRMRLFDLSSRLIGFDNPGRQPEPGQLDAPPCLRRPLRCAGRRHQPPSKQGR